MTRECFVVVREERVRHTCLAASPCAADAMHIVLYRQREAVVDDVFHVGDIETTCRHVRRKQQWRLTRAKGFKRRGAFMLCLIAMDGADGEARLLQSALHRHGLLLVQNKDEDLVLVNVILLEELDKLAIACVLIDALHNLRDAVVCAQLLAAHYHSHCVRTQESICHFSDLFGPRCTEHHCLSHSLGRTLLHDLLHGDFESIIKHAVCFVQHQVAYRGERQGSFLNEIQQTSRSSHHHVHPFAQFSLLHALAYAAIDTQTTCLSYFTHDDIRLHGQLACGCHDEHARSRAGRTLRIGSQACELEQCRNKESQGLAAARRGDADAVQPRQQGRPALCLDGTGFLESFRREILPHSIARATQCRINLCEALERLVLRRR